MMNELRITAAILTHALWTNREKAAAAQITPEDWKLVYEDYKNFLTQLHRQTLP
jgi:hypothetical protein